MTQEQLLIFGILAGAMAMFLWGRWRHDMVAMAALLVAVLAGLVPGGDAFTGFAHPAVITVACVLVLSAGLQATGAVDALTQRMLPALTGPTLTMAVLCTLAAVLSAFMNNVGALALLMPVAIQVAARLEMPAGRVLMPLAFASILGGMTTMIGTPPNLIVAGFRAQVAERSFAMFDFTPVGLAVAAAGVAFIALLGWRLVPVRERAGADTFDTGTYLTEATIAEDSAAAGKALHEIEKLLDDAEAQVVGLVRNDTLLSAPRPTQVLRAGDILVIEAEPDALATVLSNLGLRLEEDVREAPVENPSRTESGAKKGDHESRKEKKDTRAGRGDENALLEMAVLPDSVAIGRTATDLRLRTHHGINLLAISHQGQRSVRRLRTTPIEAGAVLLMQGPAEALSAFATDYGCVPLASRSIRIPDRRRAIIAALLMAAAVAGAAFGLLPAAIAFAAAVLAYLALGVIPPRMLYDAVDWPVIVLLGALMPIAGAMATTGAADLIARLLLEGLAQGHAITALVLVLVVTMILSDFMNNAATAAVMCPIAISAAAQLNVSPDSFLMAVAVGASCAFLTPIGHQNNTLILGPGGFRFGDYWKLGVPLEILVIAVAVPMLLLAWPL
ncbi:MAG: SLC13 family permease [Betaproteobacteria bacterium]